MTEEENDNEEIEALLLLLLLSYRQNLQRGVTEASLSSAFSAAKSLNVARIKAGLEELPIDTKKLTTDALKQAETYYTQLVKQGGSEVVDNGQLVFKPWLKNLELETKERMLLIAGGASDPLLLQAGIQQLRDFGELRAELAAEGEIVRAVDRASRGFWSEYGIKYVTRNAVFDGHTCDHCASLDGEVSPLDTAPYLPEHLHCRCFYTNNNGDDEV